MTIILLLSKKLKKKELQKSIEELFDNLDGDYEPVEINWGEPVGKEIWQNRATL